MLWNYIQKKIYNKLLSTFRRKVFLLGKQLLRQMYLLDPPRQNKWEKPAEWKMGEKTIVLWNRGEEACWPHHFVTTYYFEFGNRPTASNWKTVWTANSSYYCELMPYKLELAGTCMPTQFVKNSQVMFIRGGLLWKKIQ